MLLMLVLLAPRLSLLVLMSPQTHSTLFLVPVLGLVNTFIPKDTLVLVALSDTLERASQLLRTLEKHLLSPLFPLRKRLVLVPGYLLSLGSLQVSFLIELPLSSFLLLPFPLLLKRVYIL